MILNTSYKRHEIYDYDVGLTPRQIRDLVDGVERKQTGELATFVQALASAGPMLFYASAAAFGGGEAGDLFNNALKDLHGFAQRFTRLSLGFPDEDLAASRPPPGHAAGKKGKKWGLPPNPLFIANMPHLVNYDLDPLDFIGTVERYSPPTKR